MTDYETRAERIAELPQHRRLAWLCDYYRLLPTDPRVAAMTEEQLDQLWRGFEKLHPELVKKGEQSFVDPDYDRWVEETLAASEGILFDDTIIVPFSPGAVILSEATDLPPEEPPQEWVDVPF